MRLAIDHRTIYRYRRPAQYTVQALRLTPRDDGTQRTLQWSVKAPGRLLALRDAYGNRMHQLTIDAAHAHIEIAAEGVVETLPLRDGRLPRDDGPPPLCFVAATTLTAADAGVSDLAHRWLRGSRVSDLLAFAGAVVEAVAYESGHTDVASSAAQALALGRGVCQDQAHVFVAGCRALGIPARYVSGYLLPERDAAIATHAWADAWSADGEWVSIDVTHAAFTSERHCRIAVGRDYDSSCPVRGLRVGGDGESMSARVNIQEHPDSEVAHVRAVA